MTHNVFGGTLSLTQSINLTTPNFRRRLSSVLSKFSQKKNNFSRVSPPSDVTGY